MKQLITTIVAGLALLASAQAAIVLPGNPANHGTDGELVIPGTAEASSYVIDLSQAPTGTWDDDNSANQVAGVGPGIYDAQKWAVVFKWTRVDIGENVTVTFKNHSTRAPVVWLVSGDVTIAGTVNLDGQDHQTPPALAEPGPGGFRGASGIYTSGVVTEGSGFGPGGGQRWGRGGSYGSSSHNQPGPYGNASLIPLIGGSGGSAAGVRGGAAGGGAILVASTGTVELNGTITCQGGDGVWLGHNVISGGGSGGGIRIVCDTLTGAGTFSATAGVYGTNGAPGVGRIRIERVNIAAHPEPTPTVVPDPSVVPLQSGATPELWPPSGAPEVEIVSIGGSNSPADPQASFGAQGADISLPETSSTPVVVRTKNVEEDAEVFIRITPRHSLQYTEVKATDKTVNPLDPAEIVWTADVDVNIGYSAVQVRVVRP